MVTEISGNFSSKWIDDVFSKVGSGDKGMNKDQFIKAFSEILTEKISEKGDAGSEIDLDKLFSKIDEDQDGSISKKELAKFIEMQKRMPPPPMPFGLNVLDLFMSGDASDIFKEIDADGDGVISKDEFIKYIEKQKEAFQANMQAMFANPQSIDKTTDNTATVTNSEKGVNLV